MTWIIDLMFFAILIAGIIIGAMQGFVKSITKLAGSLFAIIFAITFCISFSNALESWFGLTTALSNWISGFFTGPEYTLAFDRTLTGAELPTALESINVIARLIITNSFGTAESIPAEATPAQLLGVAIGGWASVIICFVILFVIIKFGIYLISKGMNALVNKIAFFRILNQTLGGLFGLLKSVLIVFAVLIVCMWLPIDTLHSALIESTVVGAIYNSGWFATLAAYFISGEWFNDYLVNFFTK